MESVVFICAKHYIIGFWVQIVNLKNLRIDRDTEYMLFKSEFKWKADCRGKAWCPGAVHIQRTGEA